jgi:hypothetical protein
MLLVVLFGSDELTATIELHKTSNHQRLAGPSGDPRPRRRPYKGTYRVEVLVFSFSPFLCNAPRYSRVTHPDRRRCVRTVRSLAT